MGALSFLANIALAPNKEVKPVVAKKERAAVVYNPKEASLRVYKNGAVYPSIKLVKDHDLEYGPKDVEYKGIGLDIFTSKAFLNTKALEQTFIMVGFVPKDSPKVDLFGSTTYSPEGEPLASVVTQGSKTFGFALLEMVKDMYGITIGEDQKYLDLIILEEQPIPSEDNELWIPKTVSRGEKKGEVTMIKRVGLVLYPLVPRVLVDGVTGETFSTEQIHEDKMAIGKVKEVADNLDPFADGDFYEHTEEEEGDSEYEEENDEESEQPEAEVDGPDFLED